MVPHNFKFPDTVVCIREQHYLHFCAISILHDSRDIRATFSPVLTTPMTRWTLITIDIKSQD